MLGLSEDEVVTDNDHIAEDNDFVVASPLPICTSTRDIWTETFIVLMSVKSILGTIPNADNPAIWRNRNSFMDLLGQASVCVTKMQCLFYKVAGCPCCLQAF